MEPRYNYNKANVGLGLVFSFFGLVCLFMVISFASSSLSFRKTADTTEATITDIQTYTTHSNRKTTVHHLVFVEYTVDGEDYSRELGYYMASMDVGDTVTIYYDPTNPNKLEAINPIESIIMIPFMLIFGGIGFFSISKEFKLARQINRLIDEDKFIYAEDFEEVKSGLTVNSVRYLCLKIKARDENGTEYEFKSHPYHPQHPPFTTGKPIKIYVDIYGDTSKYYVSEE